MGIRARSMLRPNSDAHGALNVADVVQESRGHQQAMARRLEAAQCGGNRVGHAGLEARAVVWSGRLGVARHDGA